MENIIDLLKTYLTTNDIESAILYKSLIKTHPNYNIIKNLPDLKGYISVEYVLNDSMYYIGLNQFSKSFQKWFNLVETQYNNIINGKHT